MNNYIKFSELREYLVSCGIDLVEKEERAFEKLYLQQVKAFGEDIKYIDNPTEEMQIEAVTQNALNIKYINNPTEKVQFLSIEEDINNISLIQNPKESVQIFVVSKNTDLFFKINNPSDNVVRMTIAKDWKLIFDIANMNSDLIKDDILMEAIKQDLSVAALANGRSKEFLMKIVSFNGLAIEYLKYPCMDIQIAAIQQNPLAFEKIDSPCEEAKKMVKPKKAGFKETFLDTIRAVGIPYR